MRCRARSPGARGLCLHSTLLGGMCFLSTLVLAACFLPSIWAVAGSKSFLKVYYKNVYISSELIQDRTAFWGWFFSFILFYTFRGNQKEGTSYTSQKKVSSSIFGTSSPREDLRGCITGEYATWGAPHPYCGQHTLQVCGETEQVLVYVWVHHTHMNDAHRQRVTINFPGESGVYSLLAEGLIRPIRT